MLKRPYARSYGILQHRCLEESRSIRYPRNSFIRLKHFPRHLHVDPHTVFCVHPQSTQHDRNQPPRACSRYQVEVLAWFGQLVGFWWLAVIAFGVDLVHKVVEEDEHGVASYTAAI